MSHSSWERSSWFSGAERSRAYGPELASLAPRVLNPWSAAGSEVGVGGVAKINRLGAVARERLAGSFARISSTVRSRFVG